jgi:hypothetical protein
LGGDLAGGSANFSLTADVNGQGSLRIQFDAGFNLGGNPSVSGTIHADLEVTVGSDGLFHYDGSSAYAKVQVSYEGYHADILKVGAGVSDSGFSIHLGSVHFAQFVDVDLGTITVGW